MAGLFRPRLSCPRSEQFGPEPLGHELEAEWLTVERLEPNGVSKISETSWPDTPPYLRIQARSETRGEICENGVDILPPSQQKVIAQRRCKSVMYVRPYLHRGFWRWHTLLV